MIYGYLLVFGFINALGKFIMISFTIRDFMCKSETYRLIYPLWHLQVRQQSLL